MDYAKKKVKHVSCIHASSQWTLTRHVVVCSVQTSQQHQHAEGWDEDWSNACEEETAPSVPSSWTGAEEEEGEIYLHVHVGTKALIIFFLNISWLLTWCFSSFVFVFLQSIAELNRNSNGGSSKRISLDNSPLDSSRDTDSGTPFTSPSNKAPKSASDTEDRYDAPLHFYLHFSVVILYCIGFLYPQMFYSNVYPVCFFNIYYHYWQWPDSNPQYDAEQMFFVSLYFAASALPSSFLRRAPQHPAQQQQQEQHHHQHQLLQTRACPSPSLAHVSHLSSDYYSDTVY